jgi:hypothetical protein
MKKRLNVLDKTLFFLKKNQNLIYSFSLAQRKRIKRDIPPTKAFPQGKDAIDSGQGPPSVKVLVSLAKPVP